MSEIVLPLAPADNIPTRDIIAYSAFLKPAVGPEPKLPEGTIVADSFESLWVPPEADPERQTFRIRAKQLVFIAGTTYTYQANTNLHILCDEAVFLPNPKDPNASSITINLPGKNADQQPPPTPAAGANGKEATYTLMGSRGAHSGGWSPVITGSVPATPGLDGTQGGTGVRGADAGNLIFEAANYETSKLPTDRPFLVVNSTGGKGGKGGAGSSGGEGGGGVTGWGKLTTSLCETLTERLRFKKQWHLYISSTASDAEIEDVIKRGFIGAVGGDAGRPGSGGYGGSGKGFEVRIPEEAFNDKKLKGRFTLQSNIGAEGDDGPEGSPGNGGPCGTSWLFLFFKGLNDGKTEGLEEILKKNIYFDWKDNTVDQWLKYLCHGTEPPLQNGTRAYPLKDYSRTHAREKAKQLPPTTSPAIRFTQI
ncbi:hypothetical protein TWF481_007009 [Arthrobotrys musiformis]|uniref:Uncharacterized protein n=1 Tax=Arthrobotrys musiformis TaxID=47236 RepID=A0AAV9WA73_9PEZI